MPRHPDKEAARPKINRKYLVPEVIKWLKNAIKSQNQVYQIPANKKIQEAGAMFCSGRGKERARVIKLRF